jgi:hypothetical protein
MSEERERAAETGPDPASGTVAGHERAERIEGS